MDQLESDINALTERLEYLKKKKSYEETLKQKYPLQVLEGILQAKKDKIERNSYSTGGAHLYSMEKIYDREKVTMLEPIYILLANIQQRLETLEAKAGLKVD